VTCHRFALQCEALFQHHRNLHRIANNWLQVEKYQSGDESSHSKKCKIRTKQARGIVRRLPEHSVVMADSGFGILSVAYQSTQPEIKITLHQVALDDDNYLTASTIRPRFR
jgi:hypothetical protein